MNNRPVFVYGTLMTGQCADNRLEGAVFAGPARLDGYALYDLGRYPGIVAQPGGTVWGELWYTDDQTVEQMDLYEEEGSLYRRSRSGSCAAARSARRRPMCTCTKSRVSPGPSGGMPADTHRKTALSGYRRAPFFAAGAAIFGLRLSYGRV